MCTSVVSPRASGRAFSECRQGTSLLYSLVKRASLRLPTDFQRPRCGAALLRPLDLYIRVHILSCTVDYVYMSSFHIINNIRIEMRFPYVAPGLCPGKRWLLVIGQDRCALRHHPHWQIGLVVCARPSKSLAEKEKVSTAAHLHLGEVLRDLNWPRKESVSLHAPPTLGGLVAGASKFAVNAPTRGRGGPS